MNEATKRLKLEIELDTRLLKIWDDRRVGSIADELEPEQLSMVACAVRAAYCLGYYDALGDPAPGEFFAQCGYPLQIRRAH